MKKLLILIILAIFSGFSNAQVSGLQSLLQEGNQAYADGQFNMAIEKYEGIMAGGYESAELYFNLGNAYFKVGDIPSSILNYEKALKSDPTDKDIRFNLDLSNSRVIDKIEPLPEFFLKSWWRTVRDISSSNGWAWNGVFAFCLTLAAAFLFIISRSVLLRKVSFWSGLVFMAFTIAAFVFSASGYRQYHRQDSAIIFSPTVTVKSSPNENSVDLFVIHEGTKVFILDSVEGWSEIKLANGNVGWLKSNVYKPV